jgi:ADP-ribose pyrophosphatase
MNKSTSTTPLPLNLRDSFLEYEGVRFDVRSVEMPGKGDTKIKRDVVIHPGAVVILPLIDKNTIILIKNERFAVSKTLWELPAGTLEPQEPPLDTAYRELEEETGFRASQMDHLITFYTTPGICNEVMHAFVARDLSYVGQHLDDSERITVHKKSFEEVMKMIESGSICDAKTLTTLLFYKQLKEN